jgi:hypothetical protein
MGNHTHAATTSGPTPPASPALVPALVLALGLLLGLLLGLTSCGATDPAAPSSPTPTAAPTTPSTTTTGTTTSPTTSTTTGPPAMPDTARQHTTTGAKAFVIYFWQAVDYAQHTLDTTPLEDASNDDCLGCNRGIDGLKKDARRGATITGDDNAVSRYQAGPLTLGGTTFTQAFFSLTNTEQTETFANGRTKHTKATTIRMRMLLQPVPGGWSVETLEPAG